MAKFNSNNKNNGNLYLVCAEYKATEIKEGWTSTYCEAGCGRLIKFRLAVEYPKVPFICVHCHNWMSKAKKLQ